MEKCMYCGCELLDNRPLTVCDSCGLQVWGKKMFQAIIQNMENAKASGDI